MRINFAVGHLLVPAALALAAVCARAGAQQSTQDLAAAAQNPVAAMYSLPFQKNIYGGVGPNHGATANVLNIQPVLPFTIGNWNIISRTIAPLIYLPDLATGPSEISDDGLFDGARFGLGDINQSFYFSPKSAEKVIWGIGPSFTLPTATATPLGSGKFSMGPAVVALMMPKPWVLGMLARQLWSVAGASNRPNVSQLLLQPFVNYNVPNGWYLVSSPIITANWEASSGNRWALPIGGGIGKIFRIGEQPMNASLHAFDYVQSPSGGPRWAIRAQMQFLFPR
ncbi:MAG: neuromedin U [Candidatus Saccharimonadales bacterium]